MFALAINFTPIINERDFPSLFTTGALFDSTAHVRWLEMIAFAGTVFDVLEEVSPTVLRVTTEEYPASIPLYIDRRCVNLSEEKPKERSPKLPTRHELLAKLNDYPEIPYLLGGNFQRPFLAWADWYPPIQHDSLYQRMIRQFAGVDCSGILYELTNGLIPRNTGDLVSFATEVEIPSPLDVVIKPGHVLIYLGDDVLLESEEVNGVRRSLFSERKEALRSEGYRCMHWYTQLESQSAPLLYRSSKILSSLSNE